MHFATGLGQWRMLWWVLVIVVPLQAMLSLQLMTRGPSHSHAGAERGALRPYFPPQARPKGFEWADLSAPLATPSTERILAALRSNAHGSLKPLNGLASRGSADRGIQATAHTRAHSQMQPHHHAAGDNTVLLDLSSAITPARETVVAHAPSMAWAPPTESTPLRDASTSGMRVAPIPQHWRSHVPSLPERPPRIRDEALSA